MSIADNHDYATFAERIATCPRVEGPIAGSPCWIWSWWRNPKGYGTVKLNGRTMKAHRLSYEVANGPIPKGSGYHGTCVCHKCDVPACVNPEHLFLGTHRENVADRDGKGRVSSGDRHYTRTRPEKVPRGERHCRAKLTESDVMEIRKATGTYVEIAARFGVGKGAVGYIRRGDTWRHVATEQQTDGEKGGVK